MPHPHFRLTFRLLAAAVGWFALFLQYWLAMQADAGLSPVQRTVNFFSYFTILANLLAALAMTLPSLTPGSAAGRFFARPSVRGAIAAWIMVVAFVYVLVLRQLWNPQGWAFVADASLHYLAPALFVLDWLLFVPRRSLKPRQALWWLVLPVIYGLWTVLHGAVSGFHPYPFLEAPRLGYAAVALNMATVLAIFGAASLVVLAADRWLPGRNPA